MYGQVAACTCIGRRREYSMSASNDNDDDDDDNGAYQDDMGGRPVRPDCVPKIDLSWTESDDNNSHPSDHAVRGHVTQYGGRERPFLRRRRRRRAGRHRTKRRPRHRHTTPLTPRTPRPEIVPIPRHPEAENDAARKPEVEMEETRSGAVPVRDAGPCGSEDDFNCETTTASATTTNSCDVTSVSHDVISGRGVSLNSTCNASVPQCHEDSSVTSSMTAERDVEITRQTGSSNQFANGAERYCYHDAVSPSSLTDITRFSAGGDAVRTLERESSPTVAERLLCALDCCHCCRLTLVVYRCLVPPRQCE